MTVSTGVFTVIEDKIVELLAAQSITCEKCDEPQLDKVPCATIDPVDVDTTSLEVDARWGVGPITWWLRYYVDLEEGRRNALLAMYTGIAGIVNALGADPTLGGKCYHSKLGKGRIATVVPVATPARRELMYEAQFTAVPKSNLAMP